MDTSDISNKDIDRMFNDCDFDSFEDKSYKHFERE